MPKELLENYHAQPKEVTEKIREEIKQLRQEKARQEMARLDAARLAEATRLASAKEGLGNPADSARNVGGTPNARLSSSKEVYKGKSAGLLRRKKAESKDMASRCTLLGIGTITYKDILQPKDERFDPASLVADDDDDPRAREILKKFEYHTIQRPKPPLAPKGEVRIPSNGTLRKDLKMSGHNGDVARLNPM